MSGDHAATARLAIDRAGPEVSEISLAIRPHPDIAEVESLTNLATKVAKALEVSGEVFRILLTRITSDAAVTKLELLEGRVGHDFTGVSNETPPQSKPKGST